MKVFDDLIPFHHLASSHLIQRRAGEECTRVSELEEKMVMAHLILGEFASRDLGI